MTDPAPTGGSMPTADPAPRTPEGATTLVLGIGNLLWADEAFGVRAAEAFFRRFALPPTVQVMDGGTQGLYLVPYVRDAENLLVFDAVDYGREPGTVLVVRGEEVPRFSGCKTLSLHQTGFQDVLAAAGLLGGGPRRLTLIGVQAGDLQTWGGPLTCAVRDRLDAVLDLARDELCLWGLTVAERPPEPAEQGDRTGDASQPGLLSHGLDHRTFEGERPVMP